MIFIKSVQFFYFLKYSNINVMIPHKKNKIEIIKIGIKERACTVDINLPGGVHHELTKLLEATNKTTPIPILPITKNTQPIMIFFNHLFPIFFSFFKTTFSCFISFPTIK